MPPNLPNISPYEIDLREGHLITHQVCGGKIVQLLHRGQEPKPFHVLHALPKDLPGKIYCGRCELKVGRRVTAWLKRGPALDFPRPLPPGCELNHEEYEEDIEDPDNPLFVVYRIWSLEREYPEPAPARLDAGRPRRAGMPSGISRLPGMVSERSAPPPDHAPPRVSEPLAARVRNVFKAVQVPRTFKVPRTLKVGGITVTAHPNPDESRWYLGREARDGFVEVQINLEGALEKHDVATLQQFWSHQPFDASIAELRAALQRKAQQLTLQRTWDPGMPGPKPKSILKGQVAVRCQRQTLLGSLDWVLSRPVTDSADNTFYAVLRGQSPAAVAAVQRHLADLPRSMSKTALGAEVSRVLRQLQ